jgi:hypothetical protein
MEKYDVVIAALPLIETREPMMAPALLKGVVKKTNLSCYTFDFNAEIITLVLEKYSEDQVEKLRRWFLYEDYKKCEETNSIVNLLVNYVVDRILSANPTWVCLSLFSDSAKEFNLRLCKSLKQKCATVKIVIGGNAVYSSKENKRPYALILKRLKYIDHFIIGDGEEPLYNILTGQSEEGIDVENFNVLDDLSKQPYSDYSDYDWDLYEVKRIPMYASRGCVRRCTFCDVYKLWKKFKLKTAEDVFEEMLFQMKETKNTRFYFRDSLINGSIVEFRKLIKLLADYNNANEIKITWTSFFIFRPKNQMTEEDWKITAESGAEDLIVGVESLVDSIRYHMRKKFTNVDMDFALEMAKKYKVPITMLLIIGYVNETEKDFLEALQWLENHKEYANMPIKLLSIGGTLIVTDLSDLYQNAEDFDISLGNTIYMWENKKINLDYATREQRKQIFIDRARELGYPIQAHEKPVAFKGD